MESERHKIRLSNETRLLLYLSRVNPPPLVLEQAQSLIDSDLDWGSLIAESARHGTYNLVYKNLLRLGHVPQSVLGKFENTYNYTLKANLQIVAETDRLINGLQAKGIKAIALKGPLTSDIVFGDIGLYPSGDIDLLIKVEDIDRAKNYLEADGYKLNDKGFDTCREFFIKELYNLSLSNSRYTIEPHWNLFFRYFTAPPEFWWEDPITVSSGGRLYAFLSPEKNILYNSFRLYSKAFSQLKFLVMVAEIMSHYKDEIDWDKLFLYAAGHKFENVLRVTMRLSSNLLGAPVDARHSKLKGIRARALYKTVLNMTLKGDNDNTFKKVLLTFLRDDFFGAVRILLRRLFPSKGEIVSRYRLSEGSGKVIVFYLLNPIMLIMQKHAKK